MSSRTLRLVLALVVVGGLVTTSLAVAATRTSHHRTDKGDKRGEKFTAHLIGYNEVPSLNSTGVGDLVLKVDNSGQITFDLTFSGLSGNPAVAHVHVGQPGVSGGVSFFFCGGGSKPACPASTSGEVTGTVIASDILGPTGQGFNAGDLDSVVNAMEAGFTYANIHTAKFPAGEIRGQLDQKHGHDGADPQDG
jgi:hypothetical protein